MSPGRMAGRRSKRFNIVWPLCASSLRASRSGRHVFSDTESRSLCLFFVNHEYAASNVSSAVHFLPVCALQNVDKKIVVAGL